MSDEILQTGEAFHIVQRDAATSASRPGGAPTSNTSDRGEDPAADVCRDLMIGAGAIATFLGMSRRQLYHAAEHGYLPTFKIGALVCARRTTLVRWLEVAEAGRDSLDRADEPPTA